MLSQFSFWRKFGIILGSRRIGPRTVGPRTVGPRRVGPRTVGPQGPTVQGPICHFFMADRLLKGLFCKPGLGH